MADETPQSKGGAARAKKLSDSRRSDIAKAAAKARWEVAAAIPKAEFGSADTPLVIGDVELDCYVLNNSVRVISQRGMFRGLGVARGGAEEGGAELPRFAAQNWLNTHLSNDLRMALSNPILFSSPSSSRNYGYPATILPEICDAILAARAAGDTTARQEGMVQRAEALIRAFARVGIVALVDEATGYQAFRARDELQQILAAYIAEELLPWAQRFPDSFYQQIHRVWGWPYKPGDNRRNAYIGKLTNWLIYEQLPPGVLEELRRRNPRDPKTGRRKRTHHEHMTEDVGHVSLDNQIKAVTTLLRATPSGKPGFFKSLFRHAFPDRQQELFPDYDPGEKPRVKHDDA
ncbi:hypothetical protein GCM10008024_39250 [Allgaiera indica]|uniref:P63C domain-containing protein n=1 Tax=Allgaiera indica TaxID=765699 RepID=A0AAN4UV34_9RHOB|nr:P63C domain-containing protein [Allgaiera indica]GHE06067.1 hypothetical protein GCM10008024_39250 [Allgaiera indica]SDX84169.1 P63C domain-containing protein [Allgaiera indica]